MSCTRCGLCLESCPTYTLWGSEPDSPRGLISLIEAALASDGAVSPEMAVHVDRCLGCMACMTVCPEDVPYPELLASARAAIQHELPHPAGERLRVAALAALPRAGRVSRLARPGLPHHTPARGDPRGRVGLLLGCTQRAQSREVHAATLRVLAAEGYEVIAPRRPDCCGATELHSGERDHGLRRAQQTIAAFAAVGGVDHIVSSTGACGAALKDYGRLLGTPEARAFSSLVLDVHELLLQAPLRSRLAPLALRAVLHDACQLCHVQSSGQAPCELLSRIPGIELVELPGHAGACCGAPGSYRLTQPEASAQLGRRQALAVTELAPQLLISSDHNCIAQLSRQLGELGHPLAVHHPIQVLDRSIEAGRLSSAASH
jgi:glycolate oxidase iron-sulfur subunit